MATVDLIMPKMGESIMEATILGWLKQPGDQVELDETILEIATDKVDSEIPSPVEGVLKEILFEKDAVVPVGTVIARLETEGAGSMPAASPATATPAPKAESKPVKEIKPIASAPAPIKTPVPVPATSSSNDYSGGARFYSPLVKNIAKSEGISAQTLDQIPGSGANGRLTKRDILAYVANGSNQANSAISSGIASNGSKNTASANVSIGSSTTAQSAPAVSVSGNVEVIEMDRMRKLIADHMVMSKHTAPHVTSFVEADVTNLVNWRNKVKNSFVEKYGEKITYTPIFLDAVRKAIADFPMINVSVQDGKIYKKNDINIGMATALPSGNLIVPVIKNADRLNLVGLTKAVNDLAGRARQNKLKPEEVQGGTFTLTNVGTFGNVMGTPIINQPQVAIMAAGAIRKKPAVVETEFGDVIAIRQMMFLSLSYDHRVVDGFLGGSFVRKVADYLEAFDINTEI